MSRAMFTELEAAASFCDASGACRAIVLSGGSSRSFTAGLDLADHKELLTAAEGEDVARRGERIGRTIADYQRAVTAFAAARPPVIAAVHGACIGGGVDLICAADIRLASADAFVCVAETQLGLAADLGTLQRLPLLVNSDSWAREVCLTSRRVTAAEAAARGFFSDATFADAAAVRAGALALASRIAALSPVATANTKAAMNFSREHGVTAGLAHVRALNAGALQTRDVVASVLAGGRGAVAVYDDIDSRNPGDAAA